MSGAVPVTVVGGFLGSGKTTLMNRILAAAPPRTAVLVNDFGDLNVDAGLIASADDLTFELSGGCICCSMAEGIGPALDRALASGPKAILIEASGVAEPRRIAEFALLDPALSLHLVIVLAHAAELPGLLDDPLVGDTVVRQFDGADLVLLNHADAAGEALVSKAATALRRIAPGRPVVRTSHAALPPELLALPGRGLTVAPPVPDGRHEDVFSRSRLDWEAPLDAAELERALGRLPRSLLRLKGWVALQGGAALLQYVAGRWTLTPGDAPHSGTRLVGIGTGPAHDLATLLALG
ncbi:CobW family GTP-binding protein [Falsirhodobacter algicola]|uniref:GTP-binding protein n=1 Tax=Falsirhodobacter algicola TaxID=2692330 RepID=A0A8J8MTX3_9RHOB|nr:GTP-binding protein [Falsirhodobacter algicola]QUS36321.1 GTP-binding protein [Falsirhodobacter algicola]